MQYGDPIPLKRSVEAIQVPSGYKLTLDNGTLVTVMQTLGGNFTVLTDQGYLVRIAGKDADAMGMEPPAPPVVRPTPPPADAKPGDPRTAVELAAWDNLKTIYDPEIPVNIVDLGLVYCVVATKRESAEGYRVDVAMTMTAPGCGMGGALRAEAYDKMLTIPEVKEANVELVWDPPWDASKMSEAAKLQLGML